MRADEFDGLGDLLDDLDLVFKGHSLHTRENLALLRRHVVRRQMVERENRDVAPTLLTAAAIWVLRKHLIHFPEDDIFHKILKFHQITPSIHCIHHVCMIVFHILLTNYNILRIKKQVRQMIFLVV